MKAAQHKTPLPLTGGLHTRIPLISQSIDWIELTFHKPYKSYTPEYFTQNSVDYHPMNAYDTVRQFADGRLEMRHSERPEMGYHVILSGSVLANYPRRSRDILYWYWDARARFSRVDLAVDCFNMPAFHPMMATELIAGGWCKCKAKDMEIRHDARNPGYTQYFGSRTSDKRVRFYDKAEEQGVEGRWVRIEGQYRGKKADQCANMVASGADPRAIIRGYVDFPCWSDWQGVFSLPVENIEIPRTEPAPIKWLIEQCAPALAKQVHLHGEEVLANFLKAYMERLERLTQEKIG